MALSTSADDAAPLAEPLPPASLPLPVATARSRVVTARSAATSLFAGLPPMLMLGLGLVVGAAVSFAVGVVIWSAFR